MRELITRIADDLQLNPEERSQELPSGGTTVIASRVSWAKTYLKQAGLVQQPKRAMVVATPAGRDLLASAPNRIDSAVLQRYPEFLEFQGRTRVAGVAQQSPANTQNSLLEPTPTVPTTITPEDQIDQASKTLDVLLRDALLARVLESTPAFFERLIIDLLLAMGYGGSRADAGEQLGGTNDGGVDGVIREDRLGLDRIYLQAKRYQPGNSVGSEAVQAFIGALVGRGAQKGVLITTSSFSKQAQLVAQQSGGLRLVLIDGDQLTTLMTRFNVGVRIRQSVEIKQVDSVYFDDTEPE